MFRVVASGMASLVMSSMTPSMWSPVASDVSDTLSLVCPLEGRTSGECGRAGGYNGGMSDARTDRAGGGMGFPRIPPGGLLFGLGIDVTEAARIRGCSSGCRAPTSGSSASRSAPTVDGFSDPWLRYAARFAAKEAVGKALGIGIIGFVWRDIEVLSGGKPLIALHGGVADIARRLGVTRVEVSLSHTGGMAYAVAAALKEDADG